ncbi:MAG: dihydrodipicolinate reductase C-terminal domain-containing protein [Thermoanaerobaculia bacterium]
MKIALNGYGRMGKAIEAVAGERGHSIVAKFHQTHPPDPNALGDADVIIDFSHANAINAVAETACIAGVNLVVGTTGWDGELEEVRRLCLEKSIGVVHSANFSLGALAVFALARHAAVILSRFEGYAAGIEERHHAQKQDAPSGTAKRIAQEVTMGSGSAFAPPIASSRVGNEFGLHTLFFDSADDLIEITHRARGRTGFARGAVVAAERLVGRRGFFTLEELLGL